MKKAIIFLLLTLFIFGCSTDPNVENFQVQISPTSPPIIFQTRTLVFSVGGEAFTVEIDGPWMQTGISVINDNDKTISILSIELRVTGPDGEVRTAETFQSLSTADQSFFGVFKPEGDLNCDGVADENDETSAIPEVCDLDEQNPSFKGELFYIYDLMGGLEGEDLDPFRGGNFDFEMRLEGWTGTLNAPEESFFKVINFSVSSNPG